MSGVSFHSILLISSVAHLTMASVMALFARHRVQYLSIAWIVGIFGFAVTCVIPFADLIEITRPAILHPGTLIGLMAILFLQSIYPLSITLPGYLQWKRMWIYALPVIAISVVYIALTILGMTSPNYYTWDELWGGFFTIDMLLRLGMIGIGIYYIINILRIPLKQAHAPHVPRYLIIYSLVLGLNSCLYLWVVVHFTVFAFEVYLMIFSVANLYMCLRSLETLALSLPQPEIKVVEEKPVLDIQAEDEEENDFNELNRQRFQTLEYWMQHNRDAWKDYTFGRDQLCAGTGINRHLTLQSVRSQGYNNIHDYINAYRIAELQRMISYGEVASLRDCMEAGFGTIKTARSCFEKITGKSLDEVLEQKKK